MPSKAVHAPLRGRRVQIAGSVADTTAPEVARYAHALIAELSGLLLLDEAVLVLGAGKEPRPPGAPLDHPALTFDWTALEAVRRHRSTRGSSVPNPNRELAIVVISQKGEREIPEDRRSLWSELVISRCIRVEYILPGARSGAMIRARQVGHSDALFILGGGTGVEHLAALHLDRRRPVVPFDLHLGSSRGDGLGGAERLAAEARSHPEQFFPLPPDSTCSAGTVFASLSSLGAHVPPEELAVRALDALRCASPPKAFFVRLMEPKHTDFPDVESFFRGVVDELIAGEGLQRVELGTDPATRALMNVQLFEDLHDASVAVVDVTSSRPNCFLELGYALAAGVRVIVTARDGTPLPWDQQAIPCHFWKVGVTDAERKRDLERFWRLNINRPPIVARTV